MVKAMIWCPSPQCKRYVPMVQKDYKIYCPECGQEITFTSKKKEEKALHSEKNISSEQHDGVSPEVKRTGT